MAEMFLKYDSVSRKFIARSNVFENITPNTLQDPSFERTAAAGAWYGWEPKAGVEWLFGTGVNSRDGAANKSYAYITDTNTAAQYLPATWQRVNYGDVWQASAWACCSGTSIISGLHAYIDWYREDKTTFVASSRLATHPKESTAWTQLTVAEMCPADAVFARLIFWCEAKGAPGVHIWIVDDCSFEKIQNGDPAANLGLPGRNGIINGCMRLWQRGSSFTAATVPDNGDDHYLIDRWILLSDGNDIVDITQGTAPPRGSYRSASLQVETANKQFGLLQILEARDSARFIGNIVSLSFKAKMGASDDNTHSLKACILTWRSTADAVTSDIVDVWGATPTFVANWTSENMSGSKPLTTSWQTITMDSIKIVPTSLSVATNIAVFIFCDQTNGVVDDVIEITDVQLEVGPYATPFEHRPFALEVELCQRYYEKSFNIDTTPAVNIGAGELFASGPVDGGGFGGNMYFSFFFKTRKRTSTGTMKYYNQKSTTVDTWSTYSATVRADSALTKDSLTEVSWGGYVQRGSLALGAFTIECEL